MVSPVKYFKLIFFKFALRVHFDRTKVFNIFHIIDEDRTGEGVGSPDSALAEES